MMDADDMIHPEMFAVLLEAIQRTGADMAECGALRVPTEATLDDIPPFSRPIGETFIGDTDIYYSRSMSPEGWINCVNKICKWAKIKDIRFDEELANEDDFCFQTLTHHTIKTKVILDVKLYCYRFNPTSLTNSISFARYVQSGIRAINLRWEKYVKTGSVPLAYQAAFKKDLANDAFRIILQKNLKKNKDEANRRLVFGFAASAFEDMIREGKIETARLGFARRLTVWAACHHFYKLARIGSRLASI